MGASKLKMLGLKAYGLEFMSARKGPTWLGVFYRLTCGSAVGSSQLYRKGACGAALDQGAVRG